MTPPGGEAPRGGANPEQPKLMTEAIEILKQQGAIIVDPADIPSVVTKDPDRNFLNWGSCSGIDEPKAKTRTAP